MTAHRDATLGFVHSARTVASAVDLLKTALAAGEPDQVGFAADLVAKAAETYTGDTVRYQRLGGDELAATAAAAPQRRRLATDVLMSALLDIEIGNTLVVAGGLAEQRAEQVSISDLEQAAERLNSVTTAAALPLHGDLGAEAARAGALFGLDEVPAPVAAQSPDLAAARANFQKVVAAYFDSLVQASRSVVEAATKALQGLDPEAALQAIGSLAAKIGDIPKVGRLIAKGIALALQAIQKIAGLFGSDKLDSVREYARQLLEKAAGGASVLENFLLLSYGAADAKKRVESLLESSGAQIESIDAGAAELDRLRAKFSEQMALVARIVEGLRVAKGAASYFLPQATTVLPFGAAYLISANYALLAGMDFADRPGPLNFVDGVLKISARVLA